MANSTATTNSKPNTNPCIIDTFEGKVIITLPYKGQNSLQGYEHPSILILEDSRVLMPVLKIEQGEVTLRKFALLGKLLPALQDGTQLFISPTDLGRQLEVNFNSLAARLRDYRLANGKIVNAVQTANKTLMINISL